MPPVAEHDWPRWGVPESGKGIIRKPQAPLLEKLLSITVSLRPPDTVMPVPTGPRLALPALGALGLLLSWTLLWRNTQHEWVWVIGLMPLFGHAPSCGAVGSPWIWVLVSNPSWLLSNWEFSTTMAPPELVPEYPRALYSIHAWLMVIPQTCLQAPTYMPESLKLLA